MSEYCIHNCYFFAPFPTTEEELQERGAHYCTLYNEKLKVDFLPVESSPSYMFAKPIRAPDCKYADAIHTINTFIEQITEIREDFDKVCSSAIKELEEIKEKV